MTVLHFFPPTSFFTFFIFVPLYCILGHYFKFIFYFFNSHLLCQYATKPFPVFFIVVLVLFVERFIWYFFRLIFHFFKYNNVFIIYSETITWKFNSLKQHSFINSTFLCVRNPGKASLCSLFLRLLQGCNQGFSQGCIYISRLDSCGSFLGWVPWRLQD